MNEIATSQRSRYCVFMPPPSCWIENDPIHVHDVNRSEGGVVAASATSIAIVMPFVEKSVPLHRAT